MCKVLSRFLLFALLGLSSGGCGKKVLKDPPLALTFRTGVLSPYVLQVNNLSTTEGIEVYVYIANETNSTWSGNVVIPANQKREFGVLELNWQVGVGDKGFVKAVKYGKKLYFKINEGFEYSAWFNYHCAEIPEIDVARFHVSKSLENLKRDAELLYWALKRADEHRRTTGSASLWPHAQLTFSEKTTARMKLWKDKVAYKCGYVQSAPPADVSQRKFYDSGEYFSCLFGMDRVEVMNATGSDPYLKGVDATCAFEVTTNDNQEVSISTRGVKWSIMTESPNTYNANVPILVSANFPCERLCASWDGKSDAGTVIPLRSMSGLGCDAFVVVYGDGGIKSFWSEKATLRSIYGEAFDPTSKDAQQEMHYLTPDGVVTVKSKK